METDSHLLTLQEGDDRRGRVVGRGLEGEVSEDLKVRGGRGEKHLTRRRAMMTMKMDEMQGESAKEKGRREREREKETRGGPVLTGARMKIPLNGGRGSFSPSEDEEDAGGGGWKVLRRGERIKGDSKDSSC